MIYLWKVLEAGVPGPRELRSWQGGGACLSMWCRALTHTLPALRGGLEASLTHTVEGAVGVNTLAPETPVRDCTLVHI